MVLAKTIAMNRLRRPPPKIHGLIGIVIGLVVSLASTKCSAQAIDLAGMDEVAENNYPNAQYYIGLELYREGNLGDAAAALDAALHLTRRDTNGRWIDAIPVHAMLGECLYQAGELAAAVEHIDAALAIAIRYGGWTDRVDWSSAINTAKRSPDPTAVWAGADVPAVLPMVQWTKMATGSRDVVSQYNNGGYESARLTLVDAPEILRGLATALYRRRIIFGPLADQFDFATRVVDATPLTGQVNGQAVVASVRACGRFGSGRDNDALSEAIASATNGGQVHPLSPLNLLTTARILVSRDKFEEAIPVALAAAAAASALRQPEWVGEALLIASGCAQEPTANLVKTKSAAAASSHLRSGRFASVGAMLAATDAALVTNDLETAAKMIGGAAMILQNRDITLPRLSATGDLLAARVAAAQGGSLTSANSTIEDSLARMIAFANGQGPKLSKARSGRGPINSFATPRLFQLTLVGLNTLERGIGGKAVDERLAQYVTDFPDGLLEANVWRADHVDALAYEMYDRSTGLNAYLLSTMKRDQPLDVLVQCDAVLRHRFLATLPIAGRVQQIRRLAATDRDLLVKPAAAVFANPPPRLARMSELLLMPVPLYGSPEWVQRGLTLESLATQLALERGSLPPTMPPPVVGQSDLGRLPQGHALLTFVDVGEAFIGTLVIKGKVRSWVTPPKRQIVAGVSQLLRSIGAVPMRGALRIDDQAAWKKSSLALRELLVPDEIHAMLQSAGCVIVVPDGMLWYLPMEMLAVDSEAATLWGDRCVVTYSPTPGLVLHPVALDKPERPTGVVSSLFFSPRDAELNAQRVATVTGAAQILQPLPGDPPVPSSSIGESVGRLLVLGAVTANVKQRLLTAPGLYDAASPEGTLGSWMRFPANVPVSVYLPGYRTAATSPALGDGSEISYTLMAMHCSGVRNIAMSRWPVGGESTAILWKEFVQELPYDSVPAAWTRAVQSLRQSQLDPTLEPLLTGKDAAREDLTGDHPLFWSGYLLDAALD